MSEYGNEYYYNPMESMPTGEAVQVPTHPDIIAIKVDTPRVGVDGLHEALKRKYAIEQPKA